MAVAMRAVPLVGGPVEVRGALALETTQVGVTPPRLPAWTKEQYQNPSVYGATVMPSGVRLVFRTDARAVEFYVLTSTGPLDADLNARLDQFETPEEVGRVAREYAARNMPMRLCTVERSAQAPGRPPLARHPSPPRVLVSAEGRSRRS
ncbi:hypothetical protein [Streptomyces fungicidicus]|uniref:hypothetical protein n=1 Tax=Streptomyces fungicidicus TaxID=68203 RepID=UPI0038279B28